MRMETPEHADPTRLVGSKGSMTVVSKTRQVRGGQDLRRFEPKPGHIRIHVFPAHMLSVDRTLQDANHPAVVLGDPLLGHLFGLHLGRKVV